MSLLSDLSSESPQAGDARRLALGRAAWEEAVDAAADDPVAARARAWSGTPPGRRLLAAIFGNSPFLSGLAVGEWGFLTHLVEAGGEPAFAEIVAAVDAGDDADDDTAALMRRLRLAKRRVSLSVAVCDLAGAWSLERQTEALSRFAEAAIGAALRHLLRRAAKEGALALAAAEEPERDSGLIVLGMGKLGGRELNYSSDIDLVILYDAARTRVAARAEPASLFARLARDLVRILEERTGDGYVFRTDLRLRPDPAATPLAVSVAAALAYYESVGQNWERAALIKARPVAGDRAAAAHFLARLQPFIWRKHLDFAAIADIHSIKRQIDAVRGGARIAIHGHNIKTGRGGIREIEFFAQTQQLIWGGRLRELRVGPTCEALRRLAAAGRIDAATATALIADYRFLRRLEHRLQMVEDAQTHDLPADDDGIARIAVFLGYPRAEAFVADLARCLRSVEDRYAELFERAPSLAGPGNLVFTGTEDDRETSETLAQLGFADPTAVSALIRGWHHGRLRAMRSQRAREILTELVPEMLRIFGATQDPDAALDRFDRFLSRLPAGVQLFSLFYANPGLLRLVADVMAGAPHLADQLARRPALLDAVLGRGFLCAAAGSGRARRRPRPDALRHHRFRRDARRAAAVGRGTAVSGRGSTPRPRARREVGRRRPRRHRRGGAHPARAGGRNRVCPPARAGAGRQLRRHRDGPARQPRDDPRLRSRSDPDLRRAARQRDLGRRAAAPDRRLLRPIEPAADRRRHRADRRGAAL